MKNKIYSVALIALLSTHYPNVATAKSDKKSENIHKMYACTLQPFNRSYVDVAVKEKKARQKVHERCEAKEGKLNIFCKEKDAQCTVVKVKIDK